MSSFLSNLKKSLGDGTPTRPPENLVEMAEHLLFASNEQSIHDPRLSEYCDIWAERMDKIRENDMKQLAQLKGYARELLEERSAIYFDIVEWLSNAGDAIDQKNWQALHQTHDKVISLIQELQASINDLNAWLTSKDPRCMKCGWASRPPSAAVCPNCQVRCLSPIRQPSSGDTRYVNLGVKQTRVFQRIDKILSGDACITTLDAPLRPLEEYYAKCLRDLNRSDLNDVKVYTMIPLIEQGTDGLQRIRRAIQECDAQLIEDGWSLLFAAEAKVTKTLPGLLGQEEEKSLDDHTFDWLTISDED